MNDPWAVLLPLVMEHLPKDVDCRARILEALGIVMPMEHPEYQAVVRCGAELNRHLIMQRQFTLGTDERIDAPLR